MPTLSDKFAGCLLGAVIGDVAGAAVEGEFPGYIRKTYRDVNAILAVPSVPEPFGGTWRVGRYTDDTQMMLALTEWLLHDNITDGQALLRRFVKAFQPWRRYGPSTARILQTFSEYPEKWRTTAGHFMQGGSYGNGSAMRVAPVGLRFHHDMKGLIETVRLSSITTHTHPLAIQGATLQAGAVAIAVRVEGEPDRDRFMFMLRTMLKEVAVPPGTEDVFFRKLRIMEEGFAKGIRPLDISEELGTDVEVFNSVPYAIYCALWHSTSFEKAIHDAIFAGGDTDTVACMTGAISGALLGKEAIPAEWLSVVKEEEYSPERVFEYAERLLDYREQRSLPPSF